MNICFGNTNQQKGFNLIELMIAVLFLGIFALGAISIGGGWINEADITKAEGDLNMAIGKAKAASLRNLMVATDDNPVVAICISNQNILTVLEGTAGASPECQTPTGTEIWRTQLDEGISLFEQGVGDDGQAIAIQCMCFDNKALLTETSCAACTTTSNVMLMAGSKDENFSIY